MGVVPVLVVQSLGDRAELLVVEVERFRTEMLAAEDFPGRLKAVWELDGVLVGLRRDAELLRSLHRRLAPSGGPEDGGGGVDGVVPGAG